MTSVLHVIRRRRERRRERREERAWFDALRALPDDTLRDLGLRRNAPLGSLEDRYPW